MFKFKKGAENAQKDIQNNANGEFSYTICDYLSYQKENTNEMETFVCAGLVIFLFTYFSQAQIFNPMFLLFGYKFYVVDIEEQITFFVISKRSILSIKDLEFTDLRRINNYTYIDEWRKN